MIARFRLLSVWLALSALAMLLARATPALAHAVLVTADPRPNTIVDESPTQIWVFFNETIVPEFSRVDIFAQSGQAVNIEGIAATSDSTGLVVDIPPLAEGTYIVSWQVLSTVDGHTTSGSYPIGVGISQLTAEPGATTSTAQKPTVFSAGARWLNLSGMSLLIGLFAFRVLVWNPSLGAAKLGDEEDRFDMVFTRAGLRIGLLGFAIIIISLLFTLIAQSSQLNLFDFANFRTWMGTRFGGMWMLRFWLAEAALIAIIDLQAGLQKGRDDVRGWEWWVGLAVTIGLGISTALVSHSAALSIETTLAVALDLLHILGAGVWVGGLLQLALSLRQARILPAKQRANFNRVMALNFSVVAAGAVGAVMASGGFLAWKHVGNWTSLFGTAYGRTLLAKSALALPAFAAASINLLVIKTRLASIDSKSEGDTPPRAQVRFRRLVQIEAIFALLVLVAAGLLTDLQRGRDAPLATGNASTLELTQDADDLTITLTLDPALVGQNRFDVYITDASGQPVEDAQEVSLRFTFLGQSIGAASAEANPTGDGHYQVDGSYLSLVGPWQVEASIRRPDTFDAFAPFRMEAGLNGEFRPIGGRATIPEWLSQILDRSGGSISGAFLIFFAAGWAFLSRRASRTTWQYSILVLPTVAAFWIGGSQLLFFFQEFTPAAFRTNPILPDAESVSIGQAIYAENCVACHGDEGRGDGPASAGLSPPPADFTAGHTESHPDGDLYFWIREGVTDTAMPAFGEQFEDDNIWHMVNYIRRLGAQRQ